MKQTIQSNPYVLEKASSRIVYLMVVSPSFKVVKRQLPTCQTLVRGQRRTIRMETVRLHCWRTRCLNWRIKPLINSSRKTRLAEKRVTISPVSSSMSPARWVERQQGPFQRYDHFIVYFFKNSTKNCSTYLSQYLFFPLRYNTTVYVYDTTSEWSIKEIVF